MSRQAYGVVIAAARQEQRIFDFCITQARQIIAELETSSADHGEDTEALYGLIDTWGELHAFAAEEEKDAKIKGAIS